MTQQQPRCVKCGRKMGIMTPTGSTCWKCQSVKTKGKYTITETRYR